MLTMKSRQRGLTLLEAILAITIAGAIIVMGLRQYQSLQRENYLRQINANVDAIFQAAAYYYYANCKGGTLDILNNPPTTRVININSDLITPRYLLMTIPSNPLISGTGVAGYLVQFNQATSARNVCTSTGCATSTQIGTNVIWRIQVSALLRDSTMSSSYQRITNADCVTSIMAGGSVASCANAASFASACQFLLTPTGIPIIDFIFSWFASLIGCNNNINNYNNYLTWERLPSMASPNSTADTWVTMPIVKQFKQMYETNPITNLTNTSHNPEYQYFQCGN